MRTKEMHIRKREGCINTKPLDTLPGAHSMTE